jgi:Acetyltransferase (GNAT) domain
MDARLTHTLFEESYWLDAAAPGAWGAAEIAKGGALLGRLPYVIKRKLGQSILTKPWYTPWLGPYIAPGDGKYATEIGHQHEVLEELLRQLPRAAQSDVYCAPEQTNLMAFKWAGYHLSLAYTHRLATADMSAVWDGMRATTRTQIRKSEKQLTICTHRTIVDVIAIIEKTFGRQSISVSSSFPTLERIDAMMKARNQRHIWTAEDAQGRIHAAMYTVFDDRHMFYLAGGGDPELRQSGGQAMAMWHAIRASHGVAPYFDFAGSMVPGIEFFLRGFGAHQVPRYSARRHQGLGKLLAIATAARS